MSEEKKRKFDAKVHCGVCLSEVPWAKGVHMCETCEERMCEDCAQRCGACSITWCPVHVVRTAHYCVVGRLVADEEDDGDALPHARQPFCRRHATVCRRCNTALCWAHITAYSIYSTDRALVGQGECARCCNRLCRACGVQCVVCERHECRDTCAKVTAWAEESGNADYRCQTCRHECRREGEVASDTE